MDAPVASCFISYNHADKYLARALRDGLTLRGYRVWIDEGELRVGDSLVEAISDAIDRVDFLVALVSVHSVASSWCQKELSLAMTGEIGRRGINVLPCRIGDVTMPPALADKLYLTVTSEGPEAVVDQLHQAMNSHLAPADPLPTRRRQNSAPRASRPSSPRDSYTSETEVKMTGFDTNSMTSPRNDGTRGSALYRVPITLSVTPDHVWGQLFVRHWDHPSSFSTMHRPGIASVSGDRIILDGTTIEEVEQHHLDTLKLAVRAANADRQAIAHRESAERDRVIEARRLQEQAAVDASNRLNFE